MVWTTITGYGTRPEWGLLALAILLGIVHLAWAAIAARRQQSLRWARGPRDEPMPIEGKAARLDRAFRNYMETFPFFAAAVLLGSETTSLRDISVWGAHLYLWSRVLYVPLYAFGSPFRTLVWFASLIGLLMVVYCLFA
ncbi:MAG TPA: MAPEG family protein [Caulobacteraceae bacterium]|nr:MAPEG family protein [Caulobacteraceae bacterium]